ncbi:hypothetical protein SUDANB120_00003 [Streptomyces sp. enrichment culture]
MPLSHHASSRAKEAFTSFRTAARMSARSTNTGRTGEGGHPPKSGPLKVPGVQPAALQYGGIRSVPDAQPRELQSPG